jgi:hypothetical protein
MRPILVFEDIRSANQTQLLTLGGVKVKATRYAWLSLPNWIAFGLLIALLGSKGESPSAIIWTGILYGVCLSLTNVIHSLGHIVAGRLAHSPMDVLLLTATRDVTFYLQDHTSCPKGARLLRSFGGPLFNLLAGAAGLGLMMFFKAAWLQIFVAVNLGVAVWTLCPVPTMDGWVIWGTIFKSRSRED